MTRRPLTLLGAVAVSAVLASCAVFAGKSDYRAYREVRAADDDRAKALAMAQYVTEHPHGRWSAEIQEQREQAEPVIYEATKSSRDGLEFYLRAYPDGTYREQAQARLAALQSVAGRIENEEEQRRGVEREQREELAEQRRLWASRAIGFWTKTLLGISNWGHPIPEVAQANPAFSEAFGRNPRPRCSRTECIKFYQLDFAIPVPGRTRIDRRIEMLLRLRMNDGNLARVEMLLPDRGFSRWYELENHDLVSDFDPDSRQRAINWAVDKILPVIREVVPDATPIDVVPEPIDPPTVRPPNQPDPGASMAPGDTEETPSEGTGGGGGDQEGAGGGDNPEAGDEEAAPESLVMPLAVQGLQAGPLRVVIFAALDEDEGPAYDGLFIEHTAPEPSHPAHPRPRPRRPRPRGR